jgi:hypothetical protein
MRLVEKLPLAFKAIELAETTRTYHRRRLCGHRLGITRVFPDRPFFAQERTLIFLKSKQWQIENFFCPSPP